MPIYGEAKKRNMCRSVLPSTARKGAREDLRNIKQRNRSSIRRELRQIAQPQVADEVVANYDEASCDLSYYPNADINWAVRERRDADKIMPLMRWAPHLVRDVRLEDRLSKLRSILPDNLIGRHAISHLEYHDDFYLPDSSRWYDWRSYPKLTDEERAWVRAVEYAEVERKLMLVIERGLLARFNKLMVWNETIVLGWFRYDNDGTKVPLEKYQWGARQEVRLVSKHRPLRGIHDIPNFIRDVGAKQTKHWDWRSREAVIDRAFAKLDM